MKFCCLITTLTICSQKNTSIISPFKLLCEFSTLSLRLYQELAIIWDTFHCLMINLNRLSLMSCPYTVHLQVCPFGWNNLCKKEPIHWPFSKNRVLNYPSFCFHPGWVWNLKHVLTIMQNIQLHFIELHYLAKSQPSWQLKYIDSLPSCVLSICRHSRYWWCHCYF